MVKTKIIYISGGQNLDRMAIKMAFDEVRQTLNLGDDTLLFGVPLDEDLTQNQPVVAENDQVIEQKIEEIIEDVIEDATQIIIEKPKKSRKPRDEKTESQEEPAQEIQVVAEIIADEPTENTVEEDQDSGVDRVIPILSVLSGGKMDDSESSPQIVSVLEFSDALGEDLRGPEQKIPQTIEDIFENLTPLPEEKIIETPHAPNEDARIQELDDDATLTKLAAEFVETQESKTPEPAARSGRMGKLKNILPFKKAKKDDSGMLGDLFGWAGIAANEDDAVGPGFFAAR